MADERLDAELVRRGLARSRGQAREAIAESRVTVEGVVAGKPGARVAPDAPIELHNPDPWVARSAHKLIAALDGFGIDVAGRLALDVGASTGGFTQVLLSRRASEVIALDVGRGQLVPELRADPRVRVVEGANARDLDPARLAEWSGADRPLDLAVVDVSFIPLRLVLPGVASVLVPRGDLVALIKPQFEVGRGGVRDGLVHSRAARHDAVRGVLHAATELGFGVRGLLNSPIVGATGNREYLVHLDAAAAGDPTQWEDRVAALL